MQISYNKKFLSNVLQTSRVVREENKNTDVDRKVKDCDLLGRFILIDPSSNGWFNRGGRYADGTNAGVFNFNNNNGNANINYGARAVLLLDYNILPKGNFSKCKFKDLHQK